MFWLEKKWFEFDFAFYLRMKTWFLLDDFSKWKGKVRLFRRDESNADLPTPLGYYYQHNNNILISLCCAFINSLFSPYYFLYIHIKSRSLIMFGYVSKVYFQFILGDTIKSIFILFWKMRFWKNNLISSLEKKIKLMKYKLMFKYPC